MAKRWRSFSDVDAVARALSPSYPVMCVRPARLAAAARRFMAAFPGDVLYALKCNPHPLVVKCLYDAGIRHFDAASLPEIAQVCDAYEDAHAYFMHPVKARAVIDTARRVYGITHYVVDHIDELDKVLEIAGAGELTIVVRIKTPPAPNTLYDLAAKFGALPDDAAALMREAVRRGHRAGIAFHVGSQCRFPGAYRDALRQAGEIIATAGVTPACIDVGGGFPVTYVNMMAPPLEAFMTAIVAGLAALDLPADCRVLAEPGRALVADGCSLLVQVLLRKGDQLYINDGIYGCLGEVAQGGIALPARRVRPGGAGANQFQWYTVNGPTCDSLDVLKAAFELPVDIREGDWIEIGCIGAYSNAMASRFNGFYPDTFVVVEDEAMPQPKAIAA
jgi:ornithine decarboxylase